MNLATRRRLTPRSLLLVAAASVALAGCDGSSAPPGIATAAGPGPGSTPSASTGTDSMAAMRAWAQCMRVQSMDVPDPDPVEGKFIGLNPPGSKDSPARQAYERAEEACRSLDTFSEVAEPMTDEQLAAWRAYAQCWPPSAPPTRP